MKPTVSKPIVKACLKISLLRVQANTISRKISLLLVQANTISRAAIHLPQSQHSTRWAIVANHFIPNRKIPLYYLLGLNTKRGHKKLQLDTFHQREYCDRYLQAPFRSKA